MIVVIMPPAPHSLVDILHLIAMLFDQIVLIFRNPAVNHPSEKQIHKLHFHSPSKCLINA
jgi:hypothetical protein